MQICHYAPPNGVGLPILSLHPSGCSRPPDLSLRALRSKAWQSRSTRPEHGKAFGESVSACHALSVTFGDSSPRGRAKVASLPAMTREGGACKFVTMPLRMGWVSPSCHCILPVAAGSQVCHCEATKWPWQSRSTRPEHGKAFGESVSACYALSVTFGDSSPRGRAKVASLPAMTREGGACKFVTMPLRMGWVSPSCHCILPVAAGPQICHCEPCGARRGNLAVHARNTGKLLANP